MLSGLAQESLVLIISVCIGLVRFSKLNRFYRVLLIQACIWFMLYILSYVVTIYQKDHQLTLNNHWIFNLNMIIEATLLLLAAWYFFTDARFKRIILITMSLYIVCFLVLILRSTVFIFNDLAYTVESILMVILFSAVIFASFYRYFSHDEKMPELLAGIGLVLYFGCNLPYISLFSYLNTHDPELSSTIHNSITENLSNVRYGLMGIGLWICNRNGIKN